MDDSFMCLLTLVNIGASFTALIKNDTYPFIDSKNKSKHHGRSVFITGGNRGIGKAIAISFARAGASCIGLGCPESFGNAKADIESAAQAAGRPIPAVHCIDLDVRNAASIEAAASAFKAVSGRLDILINNAGFMTPAFPVVEADEESWWNTFEINVKGIFLMAKYFTPLLLKTNDGLKTLVNINSVAAHNIRPNASAYGTSKWAALKFTEFLLVEQASQGLLAFSVHPGGIMTELAKSMPTETHASM